MGLLYIDLYVTVTGKIGRCEEKSLFELFAFSDRAIYYKQFLKIFRRYLEYCVCYAIFRKVSAGRLGPKMTFMTRRRRMRKQTPRDVMEEISTLSFRRILFKLRVPISFAAIKINFIYLTFVYTMPYFGACERQ